MEGLLTLLIAVLLHKYYCCFEEGNSIENDDSYLELFQFSSLI